MSSLQIEPSGEDLDKLREMMEEASRQRRAEGVRQMGHAPLTEEIARAFFWRLFIGAACPVDIGRLMDLTCGFMSEPERYA